MATSWKVDAETDQPINRFGEDRTYRGLKWQLQGKKTRCLSNFNRSTSYIILCSEYICKKNIHHYISSNPVYSCPFSIPTHFNHAHLMVQIYRKHSTSWSVSMSNYIKSQATTSRYVDDCMCMYTMYPHSLTLLHKICRTQPAQFSVCGFHRSGKHSWILKWKMFLICWLKTGKSGWKHHLHNVDPNYTM